MGAEKSNKNNIVGKQRQSDDLSAIKGVGKARQQWLREVFDVHTFADLAVLSVDEIHSRLKKGQIVSRSEIELWIEQAKQLADSTPNPQQPDVREDGWHPFGSFVVEYQKSAQTGEVRTIVHHMEADQTRVWPGMQQEELCHWITEQLGEQATPVSQQVIAAVPPSPEPMMPVPDIQPSFAGELQQVLEKVAAISQMPQPTGQPAPAPSPTVPSPLSGVLQVGFSEELKRVFEKAQRLTTGEGASMT